MSESNKLAWEKRREQKGESVGRYEDILWYTFGEDVKEITIAPLADVHL